LEENMARTGIFALIVFALSLALAGCGRSSLHSVEFVDVSVGLTSTAGKTLTEHEVALSLDAFGFELSSFNDSQWCDTTTPCLWTAEGAVPRYQLDLLNAHHDKVLQVVYVAPLAPSADLPEETFNP
jgi:hypothetical protein